MIRKITELFKDIINRLSDEQWKRLRLLSNRFRQHWNARNEWWNTKFYNNNPPNNGALQQIPLKGEPEIPYQRKLFYPKEARFALYKVPVAYFSNDFSIMCCETIKKLRENYSCSWKEYLNPYLNGILNPDQESFGYPLNFKLSDAANILDLRIESEALRQLEEDANENISALIYSDDYKYSRIIADVSHKKGFDGIVYSSVREPGDINLCGYNLVVFDESKITNWTADDI
jgi:RES domain-containing protein